MTDTGQASEDADTRAELAMQKALDEKPGQLAYIMLALFTVVAIVGSILAVKVSKDRAAAALEANCESVEASNAVLAQIIGELTAPRILGPSATPEEVAAQEEVNMLAAQNREVKLAELQTQQCDELGNSTNPQPIPVPDEAPPEIIVGLDGNSGPIGLTGPTGPTGSDGSPGLPGLDGTNGTDGVNGNPGAPGVNGTDGLAGPPGPAGAPGTDGMDGLMGIPGLLGVPGAPGPAGPPGPAGADGVQGPPGADGAPGPAGPEGPAGPTGPAPLSFTFDNGVVCTDPENDLTYACSNPGGPPTP